MKYYFFLLTFLVTLFNIYPQADSSSVIQSIIEDAVQDNEDSQIQEVFENLVEDKIHINTASIDDLMQIPFLNYKQATLIIDYKKESGGINSFEQFYEIKNLDSTLIPKIKLFIDLKDSGNKFAPNSFSKIIDNVNYSLRSRITQDLHDQNKSPGNQFLGTLPKVYNRVIVNSSNNIKANFIIEKDPGEKSLTDFYSFNFSVKEFSAINNLIIGDYIFEFGQGLALSGPYSISKGSSITSSIIRKSRGSVPYSGTDENKFLRGLAFKFNYGDVNVNPFYSSNLIDCSIDSLSNGVSSIITDGYHRTTNELSKKDRLRETILGISVNTTVAEYFKFGILYFSQKYNRVINSEQKNIFQYVSLSYNSSFNKLFISGEVAYDMNAVSTINLIEYSGNKNLSLIFSYRNYSPGFYSSHSNSLGEKNSSSGESGFYSGLNFRTAFGAFSIYYDQFKFPLNNPGYDFSSSGSDVLFNYSNKFFRNTDFNFRYKNEAKEILTGNGFTLMLDKRTIEKSRFEIIHAVSKNLKLKSRFEYVKLNPVQSLPGENGYLFFQDIIYDYGKYLSLKSRVIFFKTDSYNSRIYEYENDLTGIMTNPPLFGDGIRWYFVASYKSKFGLNISFKYSETYKQPAQLIEEDYQLIPNQLNNRLTFQIDFAF